MAKLLGVVANEVPARKLKAANLSQHLFSIDRLEVFFLGLVRNGSKRHLPFNHRDGSVSQADLIAGIDDGETADSRSVGQITSRHIGSGPDGGVLAARGVAKERGASAGGVLAARGVSIERTESAGGVVHARGVVKQRIDSAGRVGLARDVASERIDSVGDVEVARGVAGVLWQC